MYVINVPVKDLSHSYTCSICLINHTRMSRIIRKPAFRICTNKGADQRPCFRYIDKTIPLLPESNKIKPLAIICDCIVRFVSDLVGNSADKFSHDAARVYSDINECGGLNDCQQLCINTLGGYRCQCDAGYRLDVTDGRSCIGKSGVILQKHQEDSCTV